MRKTMSTRLATEADGPLLPQVHLKLFSPRRTVLLFVIRDRTKTPAEILSACPLLFR